MTTISPISSKRLLLVAAATALALAIAAIAPALSRADVYCVHQAGFACPVGSVDEGRNLQPALDAAATTQSTPSAPNVITIGPGTYEPPPGSGFSATTTNPVRIVGAGIGQTTLSDLRGLSAPPTEALTLVGPDASSTSISDLTVSSSDNDSVAVSKVTVERVAVDPIGSGNGILLGGATVKDSKIVMPSGSTSIGILSLGPSTSEIDDVTVDGGAEGILGGPTNIHRAKLIGSSIPLLAQGAPVYIDDSLLVGQDGIIARNDGTGSEGSITALNDTIVAGGSNPDAGVTSESTQSPATADIQIANSIVQGFPTSFKTSAVSGGSATLGAFNDNFDGSTQGPNVSLAGQVRGVPGFVNPGAGDYHLAWNSPLIDVGDTGFESGIASATDLDGNRRDVPSSTGSSSPLDLGAYEYQHRAPTAVASATPASATAGTSITFDGSRSNDPDDGDTLTYAWSFDDGATATGAIVTHAFTTSGAHTATLTVTDPTGLMATQTTTVTVPAVPVAVPVTVPTPTVGHVEVLGKPVVHGAKVTLKLSCIGTTACAGIHIGEIASASKQRTRTLIIRLSPGQTKTITLTPNRKGSALLRRLGRLPVTITVTMTRTIVKTVHATLHAPKKPRHRHP